MRFRKYIGINLSLLLGTALAAPSPTNFSSPLRNGTDINITSIIDYDFRLAYLDPSSNPEVDVEVECHTANDTTSGVSSVGHATSADHENPDDTDYEAPIPDYRKERYPGDKKVPYWLLPECHRTCWDKKHGKCWWVKDIRKLKAWDFCEKYNWTVDQWFLEELFPCVKTQTQTQTWPDHHGVPWRHPLLAEGENLH
ncbi:hypothetical protein HD806DRAFT_547059 [Xylariaceae sp. AK1471]|nr:hypothetical protein HD806DRAFT_547059 [Xylariaceae sp. AK1471]